MKVLIAFKDKKVYWARCFVRKSHEKKTVVYSCCYISARAFRLQTKLQ